MHQQQSIDIKSAIPLSTKGFTLPLRLSVYRKTDSFGMRWNLRTVDLRGNVLDELVKHLGMKEAAFSYAEVNNNTLRVMISSIVIGQYT